ncbi:hypothetical protein PAHAL_6G023200 [Panicum hallii]|uniref:Uncharacterized protein n=1 Tax=Panicum hallii TaxID=206008 RepID=A0A2T8IEZ3_9POAL|nr:hypothetical protein PAHAL_6G023200 [Panicum hallii]
MCILNNLYTKQYQSTFRGAKSSPPILLATPSEGKVAASTFDICICISCSQSIQQVHC